jgi:hypothetical protein
MENGRSGLNFWALYFFCSGGKRLKLSRAVEYPGKLFCEDKTDGLLTREVNGHAITPVLG